MRVDDPLHRQIVVAHDLEDALVLAAGIDDHRLLGVGAGEHRAVALERADRECLEEHHQGWVAWKEPVSTVARVCPLRDNTRLERVPVIFAATSVKVMVPPLTTEASSFVGAGVGDAAAEVEDDRSVGARRVRGAGRDRALLPLDAEAAQVLGAGERRADGEHGAERGQQAGHARDVGQLVAVDDGAVGERAVRLDEVEAGVARAAERRHERQREPGEDGGAHARKNLQSCGPLVDGARGQPVVK